MKRLLSYAACIISLGIGSITSTAYAQTTANGPYYAVPAWDQTLPSNTRFIVLTNFSNQAVLDRETGLVWQRTPGEERGYGGAIQTCRTSTTGNRFGWRLPTSNELASLFDPSATAAPGLPPGHPFTGLGQVTDSFWSITPTFPPDSFRLALVSYGPNSSTGVFEINMLLTATPGAPFPRPWCVRGGLLSGEQ
jgi:Protein of unknown function (DUF1566)